MLEIKLEIVDVNFLMDFVREGYERTRSITRVHILLLTNHNKGIQGGTKTAKTLDFYRNTVLTIMKRYFKEGLKNTIINKV
jgi:hypothetical protein